MIDNVQKGQKITAEGQNAIINAVNQLQSGEYSYNLTDGPRQRSRDGYPCLFQCVSGSGFTMTSREDHSYSDDECTTTWIFLGKDLTTLKNNVFLKGNNDKIILKSSNENAQGVIDDTWFKRNGSGICYDGWIDTQIEKGQSIWAVRFSIYNQDEQHQYDGLIIDYTSSDSQLKADIKSLLEVSDSDTVKLDSKICLADYTINGRYPGTSGSSPSDFNTMVQLHTGAIFSSMSAVISCDSQLSSLGLSSIQEKIDEDGNKYLQLYDFENSYQKTEPDEGTDTIVLARFDGGKSKIIYAELSSVVEEGGGGGGYSEVKVDEVSIDKEGTDDSLELRAFQTATATEFLAERLVTESDMDKEYLERASGENGNTLEYVQQGCFKSGSDSNITFTKQNGNVYINVYYT